MPLRDAPPISLKPLTSLYNARISLSVGPPAPPMEPEAPVGETPGPRSRGRARWDPQPALGLAIRPAGAWARASGGAIRRLEFFTLTRACVRARESKKFKPGHRVIGKRHPQRRGRAAVNRFVVEGEKLERDFERYNTMFGLTTDADALAAIEELIRQTRDRLSKIDEAEDPSRTQNP